MCERVATSKEHAPPKCIFPEKKDALNGKDYRKNLIKVPSCDAHNTQRSKDDEYLMHILPTSVATNDVGINQFLTKVQRATARAPAIFSAVGETAQKVLIHDTIADKWFESVAIKIDLNRVHAVIEMNARAIYFQMRGEKFMKKIGVYSNFTLNLSSSTKNAVQSELFATSEQLLKDANIEGDNPQVFSFRAARTADTELIEFTYYGCSRALAILHHG
jgi:hypothetical protein